MRKVDAVQHAHKRQEILDAAQRCFARDGLRGASISSICGEAGISPGLLYHYFENKEAILGAITQQLLQRVTEDFDRTIKTSDALAALIAHAQQAKARKDHHEHTLVLDMLAEAGRNPAVARVLEKHSKDMRQRIVAFLHEGQEQGRIDPSLNTETAAAVLIGVIDGFKIMAIRDPTRNKKRAIELLQLLITRFLTPPS